MFGQIFTYLLSDMQMAVFAMLFVFLYLWYSLKNYFKAAMGITHVILSVPIAFSLWTLFVSKFLGFMQFMGLFIILGIGADDIFIFHDAYLQSKQQSKKFLPSEEHRIAYSWNRASGAMLVTSLTSSLAFLATGLSPIPSIYSFGYTMAFMVIVNYLLVISWFPCACIIYDRYFAPKIKKCTPCTSCQNKCMSLCGGTPRERETDLSAVQKFFQGPYFNSLSNRTIRWTILAILGAWYITAIAVPSAKLEVTGDFPKQFREDDHPVNKFVNILDSKFFKSTSSAKMPLSFFFGIDHNNPLDREGVDSMGSDYGIPQQDVSLNLQTLESQKSVIKLCDDLGAELVNRDLVIANDAGKPERFCFMDDFKEFLQNQSLTHNAQTAPLISSAGFIARLESKKAYYKATGRTYDTSIQVVQNKIKFAHITWNSTLPLETSKLTLKQLRAKYDDWQQTVDKHNAGNPSSQTTQFAVYWYFLIAGESVLKYGVIGVVVCMCIALAVLLFTTLNVIISFMSSAIIFLIVLSIAVVMVAMDWSVDFLGSVGLIVAIGLAVDYTVHLMHSYNHSTESTREGKTRDALTKMGTSVVSGAVTTFGASIFLIPCQLAFFHTFGIYMILTIVFSIIFSLVFLMSMTIQAGPQSIGDGNRMDGDISQYLPRKCQGKNK